MNESGQVFTLDMFFALTLAALIIGYSGLAMEQVRRQTDDYMLRYSLEQTANEAADVLVKTLGRPSNWWVDISSLETLGMVIEDIYGNPIPNALSMAKFENLRMFCMSSTWGGNPSAARVVMSLFDNSEKFEITLMDENSSENLWPPIYPNWNTKSSSGAESSLDVAVIKRIVTTNVKTENIIENLVHTSTPPRFIMYFWIEPGELDSRDWYVILTRYLPPPPVQPEIRVWVNREPPVGGGDWDFKSTPDVSPLKMRMNGVDYPDGSDYAFPVPLHEGLNFVWIRVAGKNAPADISIVTLPKGSPTRLVELPPVATLELKLWR